MIALVGQVVSWVKIHLEDWPGWLQLVAIILALIVLLGGGFLLAAFIIQLLWAWVVPEIWSEAAPTISYGLACKLTVVVALLFSRGGSKSPDYGGQLAALRGDIAGLQREVATLRREVAQLSPQLPENRLILTKR